MIKAGKKLDFYTHCGTHVNAKPTNLSYFPYQINNLYYMCVAIEMGNHLVKHGDGVKDIAFTVDDSRALYHVC